MARLLRLLTTLAMLLGMAVAFSPSAGAAGTTFSNTSGITIPDSGNATPYPSVITVSGVTGTVTDVTVTLTGVTHSYSSDIAAELTNPAGDKIWLMAQVGSNHSINADLTFKANALGYPKLSCSNQIVTGTYSATDCGSTNPDLGALFNSGQNPNGDWLLKVGDIQAGDFGSIAGWSLTITAGTSADTTPPVVTVPSDITAEATGPSGAVVTFTASAMDNVDGALTPVCTPASGSTFALGTTQVTCTATDAAGNPGSASFSVTVQDTTAPTISGMPSDMTVNATSAAGAVVTYTAPTATDLVDGALTPVCTPASGSTFSIGTTTVTCTATDAAGNPGSASFNVTVVGAHDQLTSLINQVNGLTLKNSGIKNSLVVKLQHAQQTNSCSDLGAFINEVQAQSGKALTTAQATDLIAQAKNLQNVLGC